jgi:hypothetical protein
MSNIHFNKEETQILQLGLNYALEKPTKHCLQDSIIDTEHAIRYQKYNFKADNSIFLVCQNILGS